MTQLAKWRQICHCQTAGRPLPRRASWTEESPGSTGTRCRLTAGGGDLRDSATENKPPVQDRSRASRPVPRVRAKRCGKSAPRAWQQGRHGKPHREQDRIGAAATVKGLAARDESQGYSRPAARVGRERRVVRRVPEEWPSNPAGGGQNPAYRLSGKFSIPLFCRIGTVAILGLNFAHKVVHRNETRIVSRPRIALG